MGGFNKHLLFSLDGCMHYIHTMTEMLCYNYTSANSSNHQVQDLIMLDSLDKNGLIMLLMLTIITQEVTIIFCEFCYPKKW